MTGLSSPHSSAATPSPGGHPFSHGTLPPSVGSPSTSSASAAAAAAFLQTATASGLNNNHLVSQALGSNILMNNSSSPSTSSPQPFSPSHSFNQHGSNTNLSSANNVFAALAQAHQIQQLLRHQEQAVQEQFPMESTLRVILNATALQNKTAQMLIESGNNSTNNNNKHQSDQFGTKQMSPSDLNEPDHDNNNVDLSQYAIDLSSPPPAHSNGNGNNVHRQSVIRNSNNSFINLKKNAIAAYSMSHSPQNGNNSKASPRMSGR